MSKLSIDDLIDISLKSNSLQKYVPTLSKLNNQYKKYDKKFDKEKFMKSTSFIVNDEVISMADKEKEEKNHNYYYNLEW